MAKALDTGKSFADGLLAKLPESLRESVKAALTAPEAVDALTYLGDGVLARSDYSKAMDEITATKNTLTEDYDRLNTWYAGKKDVLAQVEDLQKAGKWPPEGEELPNPRAGAGLDPAKFIARDDFDRLMTDQQMLAANAMALMGQLIVEHQTRFGEVLNAQELLTDPHLGKQKADGATYGLKDAYYTKHKDKLDGYQQKLRDTEINKLVDEKVAERMKGQPGMPIPLKNGTDGFSPLDILDADPATKGDYTVQAAAEEYARLQAAR